MRPEQRKLYEACPRFAKRHLAKLVGLKQQLLDTVEHKTSLPVIVGLVDNRNVPFIKNKTDFVYVDHAYFKRTTAWTNMRVVRGGHHLTKVIERPADRLQQWGVRVQPWRGTGRSVVVIPPSEYHCAIHGFGQWLPTTLERLRELTDRPVVVKGQKGGLEQFLVDHDTHAVVCAVSVAGVEAGLAGYPVFSTPLCASWPINAGPLEAIEQPERLEREPWARSLSYACWSIDELNDISKTTGNPALKEILCGS